MTREQIAKETLQDETLTELIKQLTKRDHVWPDSIKYFEKLANELSVTSDGLVLRGRRIVLPECLQMNAINIAHEGHQGLVKTKRLLRPKVWFKAIDAMTERIDKLCQV